MHCASSGRESGKKGSERHGNKGNVDGATLRVQREARIAMLAVVQMVYPTIKSDARLSRGIPCFREIQTRRTSNARVGPAGGTRGSRVPRGRNELRARRPAPIVGAFLLSLARGIFSLSPGWVASSHSLLHQLSVPLSLSRSLRTIPFVHSFPSFFTFGSRSRESYEWPKKEMCLCLDSRQIICGNKFLCV